MKMRRMPIEENPGLLGLRYEKVSFPSRTDRLTIHGWFLPKEGSNKVLLIAHGAYIHRADYTIGLLPIAAKLVDNGYNILMFDFRGHGESEGKRISAGYYEKRDLLGAIDFVKQRGFTRIGIIGYSMGAATALMTAAENKDIDAIVSDSAYADLNDIIQSQFSLRTRFPKFLLRPLLFLAKLFYHIDYRSIKPVSVVSQIAPRSILFIHGDSDETVPLNHVYQLYQTAQNSSNELWVVPDTAHVRAYQTHQDEYISRITSFFSRI